MQFTGQLNLLLEEVWEISSDVETRTVDAHVKRLRENLGSGASSRRPFAASVYRLVDPAEKR